MYTHDMEAMSKWTACKLISLFFACTFIFSVIYMLIFKKWYFLKSGLVRIVYECESPQGKYFVSISGYSKDVMWVLEVKGEYYVKGTRKRISVRPHKDILCQWL